MENLFNKAVDIPEAHNWKWFSSDTGKGYTIINAQAHIAFYIVDDDDLAEIWRQSGQYNIPRPLLFGLEIAYGLRRNVQNTSPINRFVK